MTGTFTALPFRRRATLALVTIILCFAAAAAARAANDTASPYPPPTFLPPAGHPRVYFTAKDLPRLRENATKPQDALAWAAFLQNLSSDVDGRLHAPRSKAGGNVDSQVLSVVSSRAFDYALRGNERNGRRALAALHNYLDTVAYPPEDYNNTGQTVFTIAAVYDWCYPLLTAGDRTAFIDAGLATAGKMEIGWPPVKQRNVTGHGAEGQIYRDLLTFAIATRDERPDIYDIVAGRFFSRMVEPRKFMYAGHMHPQGNHYCNYRGQWELLATEIFDRIGLPQVFGPEQRYFTYWTLYARRGDGLVLHDGDTHIDKRRLGEYWADPFRCMFLAGNYFHDPYLKEEAARERTDFAPMPPRGNQAADCVEILIFNDPDLTPRPLSELPLTHYFPPPKGGMIARTGWEGGARSPAVVAEMKVNEWYFGNHQHLDAGAFQVYYRGALATDSGYYQAAINTKSDAGNNGSSGYGSLYDVNYNKRSVAHNVVTVYDPDERFATRRFARFKIANDGGQRMPNRWEEPTDQSDLLDPKNGYRIGQVLAHGFGPDGKVPDYTYLKGDLAKAYSAKVRGYERSFAFLNLRDAGHPAALVVFDRVVSANPAFRKAWLLHGLEKPAVEGNRTVFEDTRPGYTGRLTVDTLLPAPEDTVITAVGGPGRDAWVDGTNYDVAVKPGGANEGGGWRVEVSPKTARETDYFLNVLQVGDHAPADVAPLPVVRIETPSRAGARIADRVVVFAKSRDRAGDAVEFGVLPGEGSVHVLVTDLKAGTWRVERGGRAVGTATVTEDEGVAYFLGAAGSYRLVPGGD